MSSPQEYMPDILPTPRQLQRLAAVGFRSTHQRNAVKRRTKVDEYYALDTLDSVLISDDDQIGSLRHTMGMKIGKWLRQDEPDVWRLKYYDTYRISQKDSQDRLASTIYSFEWNKKRALLAKRVVKLAASQYDTTDRSLDELLQHFYIRDDEASILGAKLDFEQVTAVDCDQLIEQTANYYDLLDEMSKLSM
ncbi:MAG: hypothetical protein ACHQTE_00340 [Candidatus Saccharimonadales bacterium]